MSKTRLEQAVLVPGFSESREFVKYLQHELTDPYEGLYKRVLVAPLGETLAYPHAFKEAAKISDVLTHSAGLIATSLALEGEQSKSVVAMNAPEPTTLPKTLWGAVLVGGMSDDQPEEHVKTATLLDPFKELMNYPLDNIRVPLLVRNFSSALYLAAAESVFPDGRAMIQTSDDQFGFSRENEMRYAIEQGVNVWQVEGLHNRPMFQPKAFVKIIENALHGEQPPAPLMEN